MTADYLIVGQGIAGSVLAHVLDQQGYTVHVINNSETPASSKVAAGMFNPLTGRKLGQTWLADDIFPVTIDFYSALEKKLDTKLLHLTNIYKPFRSIEERDFFFSLPVEPSRDFYVGKNPNHQKFSEFLENTHNGLEITQSGWVDCLELLEKTRLYFLEKKQYFESEFLFNKLIINEKEIVYENVNYKKILFSDGFQGRENPFFSWLPFNPVKGQILTAQIEDYEVTEIINQGIWILPVDNKGLCKVGSTYSWDKLDDEITEEARVELENRLKTILKKPYTILSQQAGVRPSSDDRRPFVGLHPEFETIGVFNGLGTKGVTLAPYFAIEFADYLSQNKEINPEVNISRFYTLYFQSKTV